MTRTLYTAAALTLLASAALAASPLLPNPRLTPGAWNMPPTPLVTLCSPGYTAKVRNVSAATKRRVFTSYGIPVADRANYKVDHLGPLELDGKNTVANLWPERTRDARRKDVLEGTLHRLVCSGKMPLAAAQVAIARDWPAAYRRYVAGVGK